MILLFDGPDIGSLPLQETFGCDVLNFKGVWKQMTPGVLLAKIDESVQLHLRGKNIIWTHSWTTELGLSDDARLYFDFYIGRAIRSCGVRIAVAERGWCSEHFPETWDLQIHGNLDLSYEVHAHLLGRPRPISTRYFVGDRQAATIFLTSKENQAQPFGVPGGYAAFTQAPCFRNWGYASTACPQFVFRRAANIVATSNEAFSWARLLSSTAVVRYDPKLDDLASYITQEGQHQHA